MTFALASYIMLFTLTFGFLIHLLLRGFWIGLIGINYIFPKGINTQQLNFKGNFSKLFPEASNNSFIVRLDKFCGAIFALTFVTLFSVLGFFTYVILLFVIKDGIDTLIPEKSHIPFFVKWGIRILQISFLAIGVFTFFDFFSGGRLKRIRWFAKFYWPLYRISSFLTFSFLYRRLYYTIISNIKWRYYILIFTLPTVAFFLVGILFSGDFNFNSKLINSSTSTLQYNHQLDFLSINKEVVYDNQLEIAIFHLLRLDQHAFDRWVSKDSVKNKSSNFKKLKPQQQQDIIKNLYEIYIDNKLFSDSSNWLITAPQEEQGFMISMNKIRLIKVLDISSLSNGIHQIGIKINLDSSKLTYKINMENGFHAHMNFLVHKNKSNQ